MARRITLGAIAGAGEFVVTELGPEAPGPEAEALDVVSGAVGAPAPFSSMITRWIVKMCSSPGSGYFQAWRRGWPTRVSTRYISPTLRPSCWKVAIFFESGD